MTTISSLILFNACIAAADCAPAVCRVGKHLVTVTTIREEIIKAEQVTSPEMVTLASHGQISPVL